jgi:hypothetical protein
MPAISVRNFSIPPVGLSDAPSSLFDPFSHFLERRSSSIRPPSKGIRGGCGWSSVFTFADDPDRRFNGFISRVDPRAAGYRLFDRADKRIWLVCKPRLPRENLTPCAPTHEPRIRSISAIRVRIEAELDIIHSTVVRIEIKYPASRIPPSIARFPVLTHQREDVEAVPSTKRVAYLQETAVSHIKGVSMTRETRWEI